MSYLKLSKPINGYDIIRIVSIPFNELFSKKERSAEISVDLKIGEHGKKLKTPMMITRPAGKKRTLVYERDVNDVTEDKKVTHKKGDPRKDENGKILTEIVPEESYDVDECADLEEYGVVENRKTFDAKEDLMTVKLSDDLVRDILTKGTGTKTIYDYITNLVFLEIIKQGRVVGVIKNS